MAPMERGTPIPQQHNAEKTPVFESTSCAPTSWLKDLEGT